MPHTPTFDTPIEIAPGVTKVLRDCTKPDLEAAVAISRQKAELSQRLAEALKTIASLAANQAPTGVVSLPVSLTATPNDEETLPELLGKVEQTEALVASAN